MMHVHYIISRYTSHSLFGHVVASQTMDLYILRLFIIASCIEMAYFTCHSLFKQLEALDELPCLRCILSGLIAISKIHTHRLVQQSSKFLCQQLLMGYNI